MTEDQIKSLGEAMANMLLSHAAHGLATGSLEGTGEITLRDGLIVAAAAEGARIRQAWIIDREVVPDGWTDAPVDLFIFRNGARQQLIPVGGVELKWWRKTDVGNGSNRRRDLVRDFIRAGSLYQTVEKFAFVALVSTEGSWSATAKTSGSDKDAMSKLSAVGLQQWDLRQMQSSKAISEAMRSLRGRVPIPNIFYSELVCTKSLNSGNNLLAFSRVWKVKKLQGSSILANEELNALIPDKTPRRKKAVGAEAIACPAPNAKSGEEESATLLQASPDLAPDSHSSPISKATTL